MKRGVPLALLIGCAVLLAACGLSLGDFDGEVEIEPFEEDALNFIVIGDWGRKGRFRQDDVAFQMALAADSADVQFVMTTGDNFYPSGVDDVVHEHWRVSFDEVYSTPALDIPWYATLGNHDYDGNELAQVEYTEHDDRWTMPERYYAVSVTLRDSTEALFLMLDTVPLVGGVSVSTERITDGTTEADWDADRQLRWIDSTLAASEARWKFAIGHHPVYSVSAKHDDVDVLKETLVPILERYGVQAYVAGHVHSLQHLRPEGSRLHYFVSGGGSLGRKVDPDKEALFAAGVPGFMLASLTPDSLYVRFIDGNGRVGYATTLGAASE